MKCLWSSKNSLKLVIIIIKKKYNNIIKYEPKLYVGRYDEIIVTYIYIICNV
jgi:uncharacterized protein YwgA